jgi:hypothetical protein
VPAIDVVANLVRNILWLLCSWKLDPAFRRNATDVPTRRHRAKPQNQELPAVPVPAPGANARRVPRVRQSPRVRSRTLPSAREAPAAPDVRGTAPRGSLRPAHATAGMPRQCSPAGRATSAADCGRARRVLNICNVDDDGTGADDRERRPPGLIDALCALSAQTAAHTPQGREHRTAAESRGGESPT